MFPNMLQMDQQEKGKGKRLKKKRGKRKKGGTRKSGVAKGSEVSSDVLQKVILEDHVAAFETRPPEELLQNDEVPIEDKIKVRKMAACTACVPCFITTLHSVDVFIDGYG